jgi:hypothetical protein
MAKEAANLAELLKLSIDDEEIDPISWDVTIHPTSYTKGFIGYLDITELSYARHKLKIKVLKPNLSDSIKTDTLIANITFYKSH